VSTKSILCASAIVAIAASAATAETVWGARQRDPDGPDGPEPEEPEEPAPRPPRTDEEPESIPGPIYGRESSLALCEWSTPYEPDPDVWACSPAEGEPTDDTCTWAGGKPADTTYSVVPIDQPPWYMRDLEWLDGSVLYSVWAIDCESSGTDGGAADIVVRTNVEGRTESRELGYVTGGVVEHIRPALVRGSVMIRLPSQHLPRLANDLELAIQVLGEEGWVDLATATHTVEETLTVFTVEADVAPGLDVRLAIRAEASRGPVGIGYDLRDARVFVEMCIPDENQPGTCLGD
jgi:hypothetical protein